MKMTKNEEFWKAKVGHSFFTLVAAAQRVRDVKPNSLKYQDSYDKILYSLSVVAHEFDAMYPGGFKMEEE
jgi:hypothetical protein